MLRYATAKLVCTSDRQDPSQVEDNASSFQYNDASAMNTAQCKSAAGLRTLACSTMNISNSATTPIMNNQPTESVAEMTKAATFCTPQEDIQPSTDSSNIELETSLPFKGVR